MTCLNPDGWTIILGNGAAEEMELKHTREAQGIGKLGPGAQSRHPLYYQTRT